jgi:hypothetical protein
LYVGAPGALATGAGRRTAWAPPAGVGGGGRAGGGAPAAAPDVFGETTVWSGFGQGYGYVPLVLPFVGLWWLWHTRPVDHGHPPGPSSATPVPDPEAR